MSMMLTFRAGKVAALAVCLILITACSREQQEWRSAEAADSVESYDRFLKRYPDSELATAARTRVAQLAEDREWQQAGSTDTAEAYRQFLARHPNGKWAQEARIRIQNFALNGLPLQAVATAAIVPGIASTTATPVTTSTVPAPAELTGTLGAAPAATESPPSSAQASPGESAQVAAPTPAALSTAYVSTPRVPSAQRTDVSAASGSSGVSHAAGATGYAIQLGAFTSEVAANGAWQQLTARFGTELQGLAARILPADTASGSLFRLQAPVADEQRARALCEVLRRQSQACVPVLPR
jgi:SPOR domain